jgi:protein-disulfide isomerase
MEPTTTNTPKTNSFAIPAAIVIAGALIAGAVYLSGQGSQIGNGNTNTDPEKVEVIAPNPNEHVLGDLKKAKVVIVEYSDLECPFCKTYQNTLHQIVNHYGDKVAWVYRHFNVHTNAPYQAQASECVAELGGNDKFFKFIDKIFAVTKSDNNLDPKILTSTAVELGIDKTQFQSCLDSGKYKSLVDQQTQDAIESGKNAPQGLGTPYTILVTKDGNYPIYEGAIPYSALKSAIDSLLK